MCDNHGETWEFVGERTGNVRVQRSDKGRVRLHVGLTDTRGASFYYPQPEVLADALTACHRTGEDQS